MYPKARKNKNKWAKLSSLECKLKEPRKRDSRNEGKLTWERSKILAKVQLGFIKKYTAETSSKTFKFQQEKMKIFKWQNKWKK